MAEPPDYQKQRRNTYGEAPHAARKAIPRGKQRQSQKQRRQVNAAIAAGDPDRAEEVAARTSTRHPFRKLPDTPLGQLLIRRLVRQFIRGHLRTTTFRAKLEALRTSYPSFVTDYRSVYRSLTYRRLPAAVSAVLADYA